MGSATVLVAAVLATLLASGTVVFAGSNESDLVTVEGVVTAIDHNAAFDVTTEFDLEVDADTTYLVELGPPWYWAEQGTLPALEVGMTVTVTGEVEHDGTTIEAWSLVIDGETFVLRGEGPPPWAHGPEDHPPVKAHDEHEEEDDHADDMPPFDTPVVDAPPVDTPPTHGEPEDTPPFEAPPVDTPPVDTPPVETPDG